MRAAKLIPDILYLLVPFTALALYEYATTLDQEVRIVWRRRWTFTSALLVTMRWAMVLSAAINIVSLDTQVSYRWSITAVWSNDSLLAVGQNVFKTKHGNSFKYRCILWNPISFALSLILFAQSAGK